MVPKLVVCPYCQGEQVGKRGQTDSSTQRSRWHTPACAHQSFLRDSADKGRSAAIKQQVVELSLHGGGIRDPARV